MESFGADLTDQTNPATQRAGQRWNELFRRTADGMRIKVNPRLRDLRSRQVRDQRRRPAPVQARSGYLTLMGLTLLATTHRVAPGLLTWRAWDALRSAPSVRVARRASAAAVAPRRRDRARGGGGARRGPARRGRPGGDVLWVAAPDGDEALMREIGALVVNDPVEVEVLHGVLRPARRAAARPRLGDGHAAPRVPVGPQADARDPRPVPAGGGVRGRSTPSSPATTARCARSWATC